MGINMENNKEKKSDIIQSLVITSDPQYPWTSIMDSKGKDDRDEHVIREESESLIRAQYNSINSYIENNRTPSPVLVNGDITAFGHPWQANKMLELFNELMVKHFYGLGNHDIENNKGDCYQDRCFRKSMEFFVKHVKGHQLPSHQVDFKLYGGISPKYVGSFAYAVEFGDIYSIQLNNYPTMKASYNSTRNTSYWINPNLDWLEQQLQFAKHQGKQIIVNVHKPNGWKSERFTKLITDYDVKAIFAGHYHTVLGLQTSYKENFGDIPVFLSGSASQKSYLIVEQTERYLNIYSVRNNNWKNKKLEKSIEIFPPLWRTGQIITALNDESVVSLNLINNDVILSDNHHGLYQDWDFVEVRNNEFQIKSVLSRDLILAWNDYNGSKDVFVTRNEQKEEHYWILEDVGNGYYIIKNKKNPNLVLNVEGGKTENNTNINIHEKNNTAAQKFKLNPLIKLGPYKIKTALNGTSGVDVSSAGDRNVHLYRDNDVTRSHWKFQYNRSKDAYQIINLWFENEVMAWNDYMGSKNVFVTKNEHKKEHYWRLEDVGNGYYIITNYKDSNLVLDVKDANTKDTTNIQVYERNETNAQKFKLVRADIDPWT